MNDDSDLTTKLEQAVKGNLQLRDASGCLYRVQSYDEKGAYISAPDSETHRISRSQLSTFRFIKPTTAYRRS